MLTAVRFISSLAAGGVPAPVRRAGRLLLVALLLNAAGRPAQSAGRHRAGIAQVDSVQLQPASLSGGVSSTVYLVFPLSAPAGDTVWLSTDQPSLVSFPASVSSSSSPTSVAVPVTTQPVSEVTPVHFSVTTGSGGVPRGPAATVTLTLVPSRLVSVTVARLPDPTGLSQRPTSFFGVVRLSAPAPAGGALVSLTNNSYTRQVVGPSSVLVPAGATLAVFRLQNAEATVDDPYAVEPLIITAHYGGVDTSTTLLGVRWTQIQFGSPLLVGGQSTIATVPLPLPVPAGGATFHLDADLPARVALETSEPGGASSLSFNVQTTPVMAEAFPLIAANTSYIIGDNIWYSLLQVIPHGLVSLALQPTSLTGSASATGTVTLTEPAPAEGTVIGLYSSDPSAVQVPPSVTVPAGASTADFPVATQSIASLETVIVAATGSVTRLASLGVRPPGLVTLSVSPAAVTNGRPATATLTLDAPAPPSGAVIQLSASRSDLVTVPASVTVPPGETSAQVPVTTQPVATTTDLTLTASTGGTDRAAALRLLAPVTLNPTALRFGSQNVGIPSAPQAVTLTNTGAAALSVRALAVTGTGAADFLLDDPLAGVSLAPGESRTVHLRFQPTQVGDRSARLEVQDDGFGAPHTVDLSGTGRGAQLRLLPPRLGFGMEPAGSLGERSVTLTNTGNAMLVISAARFDGDAAGDFTTSTDLAGLSLIPGESRTLTVRFTPGAAGGRRALLSLTSNAVGSPGMLPVMGVGIAPGQPLLQYALVDLGTLGGPNSEANGINNLGQVVGAADLASGHHAFLFDSTGLHDLGTLGGAASAARGINDAGQVVGDSLVAGDDQPHAFLYDGGGMRGLPAVDGSTGSSAAGINSAGAIAGTFNRPAGGSGGFLFADGALQDLGITGTAQGINDLGFVVGSQQLFRPSLDPLLYEGGMKLYLGSFGGPGGTAAAINDTNQAVGAAATPTTPHAFLYDRGVMRDLGTLPAPYDHDSAALAINNAGQIAGHSQSSAGDPHAFLWDGGQMHDLNDLLPASSGWELLDARGINDLGQIAAVARVAGSGPDGPRHAVLLSPVAVAPPVAPAAPTGLTVTSPASTPLSQLHLAWTDNSDNEAGFEIQRRVGSGDWQPAATAPPDAIGYTDTGLPSYTHVTYRVRAINSAGSSTWTEEVGGDTGTQPQVRIDATGLASLSQRVGTTSDPQTVVVTNAGNGPLSITDVQLEGEPAGDWSLDPPGGAATTLDPGQHVTITLRFTPAARGDRSARLVLTSNAPGSPHTVDLSGTGTAPVVSVSPGSLSFGSQPVGVTHDAQSIVVQNTGDAPLNLARIQIAGANPDEFALSTDGCTGAQLPPGHLCTLNVRFTPAAVGSRSATLAISDDAADRPQLVDLSGAGVAPGAMVQPDSVSFGSQPVGTASGAQTVTLTNNGSAPLTIYSVSLSGSRPGDFAVEEGLSSSTFAPGASGTLTVSFQPTAAGSRSATLTIADSAPGSPHTVALTGTGTAPAVTFGISRLAGPDSLAFGSQPLGSHSALQTVTLSNTGTAPLRISRLSLSGADAGEYEIVQDSGESTVAPGGARTVTLRFTPLAPGSRPATLLVQDNAGSGQQTVALTGTGTLPTSRGPDRPSELDLRVVAVAGTPASGGNLVVDVGQPVTLQLLLKFANGATADVTTDPRSRFAATPARGAFTAAHVWTPGRADAGRSVTLTGSYPLPGSRRRMVGKVVISVRRLSRRAGRP